MIEREFAGELRQFQLHPANRSMLYRGLEADAGGLADFAVRLSMKKPINAGEVAQIIAHALSEGHPITLMRARDMVTEEMRKRPLAELQPLAVDIIADAYAGAGDGG